jgi:hypothetical protein
MRLPKLLILTTALLVLLAPVAAAQDGRAGDLPRRNLAITSVRNIDLNNNVATLPLFRGTSGGTTVWYVLTDVSDPAIARRLGLNFAPRLANLPAGCPSCVQNVSAAPGGADTAFAAKPDFSPMRGLIPGPRAFPPRAAAVGGQATPGYSPFVRVNGRGPVYDAPIVAVGDGPFDVDTHANTHDRLLAIDTARRTAGLMFIEGFSNGKPILYLQFDASDAPASVIERGTFTPGLGVAPFANADRRADTARAAIFSFANGPLGRTSPPAQGLNHVIANGRNAFDARLSDRATIGALTAGGDAHNVFDVAPTNIPRLRQFYSPVWDLHLGVWSKGAIASGRRRTVTDADAIRRLAAQGLVTAPGGGPLGSANIVLNCPMLAWTAGIPRGRGAGRAFRPSDPGAWRLASGPGVAALLEERRHALAEVLAAVGLGHQVRALGHVRVADAAQRLLRDAQRDRRVAGDALGELERVGLDLLRRHDRAHQPGGERLLGADHAGGEDDVLGARLAEDGDEAGVAGHRQAVAQRARDRQAELRVGRAEAQVARRGDRQPRADRVALDDRDRRLAQAVEPADVAVDVGLVLDARLAAVEVEELADVGARDERATAGAAQDEDADCVVGVDLVAVVVKRLVHRERHRVARVRAVERDDRGGAAALVEQLRRVFGHGAFGGRRALSARRRRRRRRTRRPTGTRGRGPRT